MAVVVAVAFVRMMEMPIDEVIHVVAVRHGRMAAFRAVDMLNRVCGAFVVRRAGGGVRVRNFQHMLVHVIAVRMVDVAVVEVIHVVRMFDRRMPAALAMNMRVPAMDFVRIVAHWVLHHNPLQSAFFQDRPVPSVARLWLPVRVS